MGIRARPRIYLPNTGRCALCAAHLHRTLAQIQARGGARTHATKARRRVRSGRQPRCSVQLCRRAICQVPMGGLSFDHTKVRYYLLNADMLLSSLKSMSCRILGLVSIHNATMPLHIACMYHLSHLHSKLFILAHEMVDREPENPISWYAVGVWYLSRSKWAQARQYFRFGFLLFFLPELTLMK
jgi:hypothetical protein